MTVHVSPYTVYVLPDGRLTRLGLELFAALQRAVPSGSGDVSGTFELDDGSATTDGTFGLDEGGA
jgi:hypothetical protein